MKLKFTHQHFHLKLSQLSSLHLVEGGVEALVNTLGAELGPTQEMVFT